MFSTLVRVYKKTPCTHTHTHTYIRWINNIILKKHVYLYRIRNKDGSRILNTISWSEYSRDFNENLVWVIQFWSMESLKLWGSSQIPQDPGEKDPELEAFEEKYDRHPFVSSCQVSSTVYLPRLFCSIASARSMITRLRAK